MSTCGAQAEFTDPLGDVYPVWCSLPKLHGEEHAGRVWWSDEVSLSPAAASSGVQQEGAET